jgi:hypothetical protein
MQCVWWTWTWKQVASNRSRVGGCFRDLERKSIKIKRLGSFASTTSGSETRSRGRDFLQSRI